MAESKLAPNHEIHAVRAQFGIPDPSSPNTQEEYRAAGYRLTELTEGVLVTGSRGARLIPWGAVKYVSYVPLTPAPAAEDSRPARSPSRALAAQ